MIKAGTGNFSTSLGVRPARLPRFRSHTLTDSQPRLKARGRAHDEAQENRQESRDRQPRLSILWHD